MKLTQKEFLGMVTVRTPGKIPVGACVDSQNVIIEKGLVRTRPGYKKSNIQLYDGVLGMFNFRGALHGHEQMIVFTDNVSRDGLTDNGGLIVMPSIDIHSDYYDEVEVLWDWWELWHKIASEQTIAEWQTLWDLINPLIDELWDEEELEELIEEVYPDLTEEEVTEMVEDSFDDLDELVDTVDTLTDAEIYPQGAHWCYNEDTGLWEYTPSGKIPQNCIPDSLMPDSLKTKQIQDAMVTLVTDENGVETYGDTNYGSDNHVHVGTRCRQGVVWEMRNSRIYIRCLYAVENAKLYFYVRSVDAYGGYTDRIIDCHSVTETWHESTITWNNKPAISDERIDTVTIPASGVSDDIFSVDVGSENNVCLKMRNEYPGVVEDNIGIIIYVYMSEIEDYPTAPDNTYMPYFE